MIFFKGCDVLSVSPSDAISNHFSVIADLKIPTDHIRTIPQTITYLKLKASNMKAFKADIKISDLIRNPKSNATELAPQYGSVLNTLSDLYAFFFFLPKRSPPNLLTSVCLLQSWLPKDIVDTSSVSGVDIQLL